MLIIISLSHVATAALPLVVRWDTAPTTHESQQMS